MQEILKVTFYGERPTGSHMTDDNGYPIDRLRLSLIKGIYHTQLNVL